MYEFRGSNIRESSFLIYEFALVAHPDDLSAGIVIRIGSLYLRTEDRARIIYTRILDSRFPCIRSLILIYDSRL